MKRVQISITKKLYEALTAILPKTTFNSVSHLSQYLLTNYLSYVREDSSNELETSEKHTEKKESET